MRKLSNKSVHKTQGFDQNIRIKIEKTHISVLNNFKIKCFIILSIAKLTLTDFLGHFADFIRQ